MDLYSILKFLHVTSAIIWVGGGFVLVLLGVFAASRNDQAEMVAVVKNVAFLSTRVFVPTSLATLVFGVLTAFVGGFYGMLWIWIGIAGFVATFLTGLLILGPTAEKMVSADKAGNAADAGTISGGLLKMAKFDYVVLAVVVADMVIKPGFGDWLLLVIMISALVAGAYFFLGDLLMKPSPAKA